MLRFVNSMTAMLARAAGFSLREFTKIAEATAIPVSRGLKPADQGVSLRGRKPPAQRRYSVVDGRVTVAAMLCCFALSASTTGAQPPRRESPSALPELITPQTKEAIDRGLAYLARTQDRDGSWSNRTRFGQYPVAMTGLAGIALLMDGNTTTQGRYAAHVDRAAKYLVRSSSPSGLIARETGESRPMYGHGFAMLFLSQLHGMVEDAARAEQMQEVLRRAVELTSRSQSARGGWFYTPGSRSDEGSVTVTQVQALRSCRNVGVAVPKTVIDAAMAYLADSQNSDGGIRYTVSQQGGSSRPALTPAAVCCWFNAGEYDNPHAKRALEYCKRVIDPKNTRVGHDYYMHLYLSQALYISRDASWETYFTQRRDVLLLQQRSDGSWLGDGVGDVYGTAVALIILQLPYNQLPIMQP
ncbi:MAG: terpene cyclase/mutase family protein [Planctomycetes bacterium]|nr:terpene cyclase/mutase family protein [Planctomycetota bacterium]